MYLMALHASLPSLMCAPPPVCSARGKCGREDRQARARKVHDCPYNHTAAPVSIVHRFGVFLQEAFFGEGFAAEHAYVVSPCSSCFGLVTHCCC